MRRAWIAVLLVTSAAGAQQISGPPKPDAAAKPASQEAIDRVKAAELRGAPRRCRQNDGEIVVCGSTNGSSPYRLPLPTETKRLASEPGHVDIGGSPVGNKAATGIGFTLGGGKKATLKGLGSDSFVQPVAPTTTTATEQPPQ